MQRLIIGQIAENKVIVSGQPLFRWMPLSVSPTGVTKAQEALLKRKQEECESQGLGPRAVRGCFLAMAWIRYS